MRTPLVVLGAAASGGHALLGFVLGVVAALAFGLGMALQKRRALDLPSLSGGTGVAVKAFLLDPTWWGATAVVLLGWVLEFVALVWAPIALVLPSMVLGIAVLALLAARWFRERLGRGEWFGVGISAVGIVLGGLSIDAQHDVAASVFHGGVLLGAEGALGALALLSLLVVRALPAQAELGLATAAGLFYACTGLLTKALTTTLEPPREILLGAAVLVALVVLSVVAVFSLQAAFQRGRATVVVAWTGVLSSFLPAALGGPVFGELWPAGVPGLLRALALLCLAGGFSLLVKSASRLEAPRGERS